MIIRYADENDATMYTDVILKTWRSAYAGIFDDSVFDENERNRDTHIQRYIKHCNSIDKDNYKNRAVAVVDDKVVGVMSYGKIRPNKSGNCIENDSLGEISAIYVLDDYQKKSIGKKLYEFAKNDLKRRNFMQILIWALKDNPNIGFYNKIGGKEYAIDKFTINDKEYDEIGFIFDI